MVSSSIPRLLRNLLSSSILPSFHLTLHGRSVLELQYNYYDTSTHINFANIAQKLYLMLLILHVLLCLGTLIMLGLSLCHLPLQTNPENQIKVVNNFIKHYLARVSQKKDGFATNINSYL